MPNPVQAAVETYIRAWSEPDPAVRAAMIEACFAEDGRMVTRSREIRGRAALAEEMTRIRADPRLRCVRLTSAIDAQGTTFRFRGVVEHHDGATFEASDAGEVDASGHISLLLTFAGPLRELDQGPT